MPLALALRAGVASIRGDGDLADALLARAGREFERAEMMLHANAVAYRRGETQRADTWMKTQGVKNAARLADVLLPGF